MKNYKRGPISLAPFRCFGSGLFVYFYFVTFIFADVSWCHNDVVV